MGINKKINNYLQKNCNNKNNKVCISAINKADNYLKKIENKIENYNIEINISKNTIKNYSNNLSINFKPISNVYSHPINKTFNNKCHNLSAKHCVSMTPICQWNSEKQLCLNNSDLCENKTEKSTCENNGRCSWKENKCHNIIKLESRYNPSNNGKKDCSTKKKENCINYPCSWNHLSNQCENLRHQSNTK